MIGKSDKLKSVRYFLEIVLNVEYPLQDRKEEMLRVGDFYCGGFPEWSDIWGNDMRFIDDIPYYELESLLDEIEETDNE